MTALDKQWPPTGRTAEGQPSLVEASGTPPFAHCGAAGKPENAAVSACKGHGHPEAATVAYRAPTGRVWRYGGKRGQVLAMLATMPAGLTQWDTLPWHTRLGGTIHVLRRDGLAIDTEREGEYRHARYRLSTPGSLIIHSENSERAA